MKKITLQEVADSCGLSLALVSRAVNGKPGVSDEARRRVLTAVEELGYVSGSGLAGRRQVAILSPDQPFQCYGQLLLSELSSVLTRRGYCTHTICLPELLKSYPWFAAVTLLLRLPDELDIPVIAINNPENLRKNLHSVRSDEAGGMEMAVDYLHRQGHRRIGLLLFETAQSWTSRQRREGFLQAMHKRQLPGETCLGEIPSHAPFYETLGRLVSQEITALIVPGEGIGQRVCRALHLYRYRIPEDISVIAWEQPGVSGEWIPPLTTIGQDFQTIAERTADLLDEFAHHQSAGGRRLIPYRFFERESVRSI